MEAYAHSERMLHSYLSLGEGYQVFFLSSATECWQLIAQTWGGQGSLHPFTGAFGQKWQRYTQHITGAAEGVTVDIDTDPISVLPDTPPTLICLTHNETSNGAAIPSNSLAHVRSLYPQSLIAIDATSSLAGIELDINQADIVFASCQKCLGMPAGLAVLICSPRAIDSGLANGEQGRYNSFDFLLTNARKQQTTHTPNMLAIASVGLLLTQLPPLAETGALLEERSNAWQAAISESTVLTNLVTEPSLRSKTVLCLTGEGLHLSDFKTRTEREGYLLGSGYGTLHDTTLRIANFPAIPAQAVESLQALLRQDYL
jgi:phosphoserine aminotransferase